MTKLQTLQNELARLNTEVLTDTGFVLRVKQKRISVIIDTLARETLLNSNSMNPTTQVVKGDKGDKGNDIDPNILNAKLDCVQYETFQDLPAMPVITPKLGIVATDNTNDNTETVYLMFGSTRKLLVTITG